MAYAATPSCPPPPQAGPAGQIMVVGPQFLAPYPVDLVITKKLMTLAEGTFAVSDVNGNVMFKVKGSVFSLHDTRLLLDNASNPVVSLRQKILSAHRRWQVYRGESSDDSSKLFTVKKSSLLQFKTQLDVFLAGNTREELPDFKIKGSWFERSCTIYLGDTSTIIAQMHKKHSAKSILLGKDTFSVTVYPNVDYAFVVALVVILYEINEDRKGQD